MVAHITAADGIYDELKRRILDLVYKPGDELNMAELAAELQISRSPIRDALIKLSGDNLVDIFPQRGTRVSFLNLQQVEEERFLREALEIHAVRLYVGTRAVIDETSARRLLDDQRSYIKSGDFRKLISYDDAFHEEIFKAVHKSRCWNIIENQSGNYHRMRILSVSTNGVAEKDEIVVQHENLLDALLNYDSETALKIEKTHLSRLENESAAIIEAHPDYFVHQIEKRISL